ncbi:MAG TPA: HAD family hydrolase [Pilimelia sp.]|nr:HAD family hydrolase [Pilimelia sp.]
MAERRPDGVSHRRPSALLLDLDETLLDNSGIPEAVAATCDAVAAAVTGLDARHLRRANTDAWQSYWPHVERSCWLGQLDGFAASREAWRRTLHACGCTDEAVVQFAFERHQRHSRDAYRLFADAADLLAQVAGGPVRLGLVTNGPADLQRDKLRCLGLDDVFDTVVISGEIGAAKPDPAPFLLALRRLAVQPSDAWHVGDSLASDVAGARAAGMLAVWLNRHNAQTDAAAVPDVEVASLSAVATWLCPA